MDATNTTMVEDSTVVVLVDYHTLEECYGVHAAKPARRFAALETIRYGGGVFVLGFSDGMQLWHDHGLRYISDNIYTEIALLAIGSTSGFVRIPQDNDIAQRFACLLKDRRVWIHNCYYLGRIE